MSGASPASSVLPAQVELMFTMFKKLNYDVSWRALISSAVYARVRCNWMPFDQVSHCFTIPLRYLLQQDRWGTLSEVIISFEVARLLDFCKILSDWNTYRSTPTAW